MSGIVLYCPKKWRGFTQLIVLMMAFS